MAFEHYKTSEQLCEYIANRANGVCMLSFSCGKDSIASWLRLRKYFHTIYPVFYYRVPKISFVERSLQYYENYFQTKIIRVPSPATYRMLLNGVYQTPRTWQIAMRYPIWIPTFDDIFDMVKQDLKLPQKTWLAIGNRMFDNINRYGAIKNYGAHNEKRVNFFPIYDFKIADVAAELKKEKIKLPIDYKLFGKTFDGLDYRFISVIRKKYPEDYEKIKSLFPLIDVDIYRYEAK